MTDGEDSVRGVTAMRVAIGIAAHAEPARFRATLAGVRRTVPASVHVLAVADHPDAATAAALDAERGLDVLALTVAAGGAAAFNRLLGGTRADVCVLLESGCIPAAGWLERLLAGLAADPRNGLAGPSTNRSWNEQGAEPRCIESDAAIAAAARRLAGRHGTGTRTLEPLYSLADFCYAVRREVWNDVGAADEEYGTGPCWEMDYSARAARAGWRGVWVPGAFVWRAPFTARRAAGEQRLLETNRRRYQDRLCGRRLRGEGGAYEPHCRGDACEHFAPAGLIQIRIDPPAFPAPPPHPASATSIAGVMDGARSITSPRASAAPARSASTPAIPSAGSNPSTGSHPSTGSRASTGSHPSTGSYRSNPAPATASAGSTATTAPAASIESAVSTVAVESTASVDPTASTPSTRSTERIGSNASTESIGSIERSGSEATTEAEIPLISCIMPTRGRPELAMQAVRYFLAQDYPRRELIILDDAGGELGARLPADPRVRYAQLRAGESVGAKRNRGVELARGEIVAQWDDDDWYARGRLSAQAAPILEGRADVTALRCETFFDLERWEFWACTDALHRRLFVRDVHGGTLVFRRRAWGGRARYPRASLAEDAAFLVAAQRGGARLLRMDAPGLFVYLRHGANAWNFACGRYLDPRGWRRIGEPPHLALDRGFYRARSPAPPSAAAAAGDAPPSAPRAVAAVRVGREERPLVSCLMPTADRRVFVPRAIEQFQRQTYAPRELVIVDDGADSVADLMPDDPRIRYVRAAPCASLGAKRNLACSLARGTLLAHWDDDDWMAEGRLAAQVDALEAARADVCGLSTVCYFDPVAGRAWEYRWRDRRRAWVGGNTLLYRRTAWERRPFPGLNEGEDTRWIFALPAVHAMPDGSWFAAMVHGGNTSPKQTRGAHWHPIPLDVVRGAMGDDWPFYAALAGPAVPILPAAPVLAGIG